MSIKELIMDRSEMEKIADLLSEEIRGADENIVSRYIRAAYDTISFSDGKKTVHKYLNSNLNKETMGRRIYTQTSANDLFSHNFMEITVARDLKSHRFNFNPKGIALPKEENLYLETIPSGIDTYDEELKEFTITHKNTRLLRELRIEQMIVVNSKGGKVIQSIPFFLIVYSHGYNPIMTNREICIVCNSKDEIKRMPVLIKYLADPTPDKKITKSKTFTDAFDELYKISGLKFGSLEEAGISISELYDVIMLNGIPVHEIFGHQFEEPVRLLDPGESGTFKYNQKITNKDIVILDSPRHEIAGFRVQGFTYVDAYGRKREPVIHIKDGKVVGFLGGEYIDDENLKKYINLEKSEFVGSSSQYIDGRFPQPRMSCTIIDGKTENLDMEGKILLVCNEGSTQQKEKTYMVSASECYVVRDKKPERIIPLQVTGGINQALRNLILLKDSTYQIGMCGKPEPVYYPQPRGNAEKPVSQFTRNQMWKEQQVYPMPISDFHLKIL